MKNHQIKTTILPIFGLLLSIPTIHSQTVKEIEVYNLYDTTVGKQNLDINNGIVFTDPYSSAADNIYFDDDKFEKGSLSYEGQIYYDTSLKYDIYRDILILNPQNTSNFIGIHLIKEKVESFSIYNRKFVKLNKEQFNLANFNSGYYEISENSSEFIFYTQHNKKLTHKKIGEDGIAYRFKRSSIYYLLYKKTLYNIDSKSEILKIFPDQKRQINEFYLTNRELKKSDPNRFMDKLMKSISNALPNQTK